MYKHQTNMLPQTCSNYLIKHNEIHKYPTRNAENYAIHRAKKKKKFPDRFIRLTGPILWNSLDSKIKRCKPSNTLEMSLNQVLWLSITLNNFDNFWHVLVFVFIVVICFMLVRFIDFVCNLSLCRGGHFRPKYHFCFVSFIFLMYYYYRFDFICMILK